MSGIVGIINLDGAPVSRELLERMTSFMAYRGPDAQNIWVEGAVGFGHTLLVTTFESVNEHQPCSIDSQVWITADARVDGRADLIEQLQGKGCGVLENVTDGSLILHAYHVWGDNCVEHLIGDFAFAIWDRRQQRLFCARDQFGVKPFYYARVGNSLVFSNTLNCVRLHPDVSDKLNERAIGDFLLFDYNFHLDSTTFADIQRIPGGHTLTASQEGVVCQRYWTLPITEPIRYRRDEEYVEHFLELMRLAVGDRLRQERVGILMSGGLDSTTIAATALQLKSRHSIPLDLQAFTTVYDRLLPDEERYYSGIAAEALGLPIHYLVADDYQLFERWDRPELPRPEPIHSPLLALSVDQLKQVAAHSRVVLYGHGGDEVLATSRLMDVSKTMPLQHLIADVVNCILAHRIRPPIGIGIREAVEHWLGKQPKQPQQDSFPAWLNQSFTTRMNLQDRWLEVMEASPLTNHPSHPRAYNRLMAIGQIGLANSDPGVTAIPIERRLPFLDLRLINYLLAIPPLPWSITKYLARVAMRGTLPEIIRHRPKTPIGRAGDPIYLCLCRGDNPWSKFTATSTLWQYCEEKQVLQEVEEAQTGAWAAWRSLRPISLNYWLKYVANKPF